MVGIALRKIEERELLNQKVYRALKEAILKGEIAKGEKLIESQIAQQLGTSRTPVREAINRLAVEGLVELVPNQGAFVAEISMEDIEEVFQIRSVLEGLAVRLFARRSTDEHLRELEIKLGEMKRALEAKDTISYGELDASFHRFIWSFSGSKRLLKILDGLMPYIDSYRLKSLYLPHVMEISFEDHLNLLNLLKGRKIKESEELMRRHVERVLERILCVGREEP